MAPIDVLDKGVESGSSMFAKARIFQISFFIATKLQRKGSYFLFNLSMHSTSNTYDTLALI